MRASRKRVWCADLKKMEERILCRLRLLEDELRQEHARKYLPEECRALRESKQKTCVQRYRAFQPCWAKPVGPERTQCAERVLLQDPKLTYVNRCVEACSPSALRGCCRTQAQRQKIADLMVKFRIYDLAERAEESKVGDVKIIAEFITAAERAKQKYNQTKTVKKKKALIATVRTAWGLFRLNKQTFIVPGGEDDGLDAAFKELK